MTAEAAERITAEHPECSGFCTWVWWRDSFWLKYRNYLCPLHGGGDRRSDAPARACDYEGNKRKKQLTKAEMAERGRQVAAMRALGHSSATIAEHYQVSLYTVWNWEKHAHTGEPTTGEPTAAS